MYLLYRVSGAPYKISFNKNSKGASQKFLKNTIAPTAKIRLTQKGANRITINSIKLQAIRMGILGILQDNTQNTKPSKLSK